MVRGWKNCGWPGVEIVVVVVGKLFFYDFLLIVV